MTICKRFVSSKRACCKNKPCDCSHHKTDVFQHFEYSLSFGALFQFTGGDTAEDSCSTKLRAANIVVTEKTSGYVSIRIQTSNRAPLKVLNFCFYVDERSPEGSRHAALIRNGIGQH